MPIFNKAINPKGEVDFSASLMPVRAKRIKTVKPIPENGMQGGASQVSNGTVYIPTKETAEGRTIRFHEAMHVAHTKAKGKFKDLLDQALEDARLHCYCSKASQSQFQQARRDELAVGLRDLRAVSRSEYAITPRASLAVIRAFGILRSAPIEAAHTRLLDKVFAKFGPKAKADFSQAIDVLAKCTGDTSTKTWKQARKIVQDYFKQDFEGQQDKPESKPEASNLNSSESENTRSVNGQTAETLPQESDEDESEDSDSMDSKSANSKDDDSKDESDSASKGSSDSDDDSDEDDSADSESGDADDDEDSEDDSESDSETGESDEEFDEPEPDSEIAIAPPVDEPKKPRAKKAQPDEYTADLAPECDKEWFDRKTQQTPLKLFIRRLDMTINRVKIDLGRHAPTPTINGRNILARKLAAAVTTPGTRVFSRPVSQGGFGTILIDASDSMNMPEDTLIEFLSKAPALTLAFYNAPTDRRRFGNIFIYAANGYRASVQQNIRSLPHYGWGNVIDYHAMAWLIKQPAPHYIVTDQKWTGPWDREAARLCAKLKASGQIIVVPDLQAMAAILEKRGRKS